MFKVIIAGGRDFNNYTYLKSKCDHALKNKKQIQIVSGKAKGADSLGEQYAKENNLSIKEFPADWDNLEVENVVVKTNKWGKKYNALAGLNRNEDMAKYADALIAFWDGESTGTKNMIDLAEKYELKVKVYPY